MPVQSLDSVRSVTRGNPQNLRNLFFQLTLAFNQVSAVWEENARLICSAQAVNLSGEPSGQLTFLATEPECTPEAITGILENLIQASGTWQVRYLLCDLPVDSDFLPSFRRADFNIWARQRLFCFTGTIASPDSTKYPWHSWNSNDIKAMMGLHRNLVPKLFQNIEPLTRQSMLGLVLYDERNTLLGYADLEYGPRGIWVQPFLLPEADDPQILLDLLAHLPATFQRPVSICARSYQPWLEDMLSQLPAEAGEEQALLVHYLVIQEKLGQALQSRVFETYHNDGSVPAIQTSNKRSF